MSQLHYLFPTWPAPAFVKACTTLRMGGHSHPPYDSFNLNTEVGDDPVCVAKNRQQLCQELHLHQEPFWINQVHGTKVVCADTELEIFPQADAVWTNMPGVPCGVLTADCLPLLICDPKGLQIAAIHAGWRGLAAGVIEATLDELSGPYADLLVWLGPAIGPTVFEVGEEVRELFVQADPEAHLAFSECRERGPLAHIAGEPPALPGKYLADIYQLARQRLSRYGVKQVYGGEYCTVTDAKRFFSFRRDNGKTGRMSSLIWIEES